MSSSAFHEVTAETIDLAKKNPNGWVYKIEGEFSPDQDIPPEAIVGAWKVDENGGIEGEFIANQKYISGLKKGAE